MAKVILQSINTASSISAGRFLPLGGNVAMVQNSSGTVSENLFRSPGTFTELYINILTNDRAATTVRTRKNGANGGLSVSVTGSTTGVFRDTSGSDTVSAGDLFCWHIVPGAGGTTFTFGAALVIFDATTNTSTRVTGHEGGTVATGNFMPIAGSANDTATESNIQTLFPGAGTAKNGGIQVSTNTRDGNVTYRTRLNSATDGNITVTSTTTTTGFFEDTTNSDTISAGDTYYWKVTLGGTTGDNTVRNMDVDFETTDSTFPMINMTATTNADVSANTTRYFPIAGRMMNSATESDVHSAPNLAFTWSKISVLITSNTVTATSTLKSRVNGADGNQSATITASTTGRYSDSSNSDTIASGDALSFVITAGATGTTLRPKTFSSLGTVASGSTAIKTWVGLADASTKTVVSLARASVKTKGGLA